MINVTYYYSACVGLHSEEVSVLCDPWFTEGAYDGSWYHYPPVTAPLETVGRYDLVYVSHIHPDHYDPVFLRQYLAKYPGSQVVIADFKQNFLSKKMMADGIPHRVLKEERFGDSVLKIFANELDELDVDSALVFKRGAESVVNMNDNLFNPELISRIRAFVPEPTIALLGYTGAGPYPQTYYDDPALLATKAEEKRQAFFERYRVMKGALAPKKTVPFAGKYVLAGKLAALNPFRGVADAVDVALFDPDALVLDDGGKATVNTKDLKPSRVRTEPYSLSEIERYVRTLADKPMEYETYFAELPEDVIPFRRLIPKAFQNALARSICKEDVYLCVKLPGEQGWFAGNVRQGSRHAEFMKDVSGLTPRSEVYVDPRYLFGLLTCVFHWNNAEVGSQYATRRVPDVFRRDFQGFMNFFHV